MKTVVLRAHATARRAQRQVPNAALAEFRDQYKTAVVDLAQAGAAWFEPGKSWSLEQTRDAGLMPQVRAAIDLAAQRIALAYRAAAQRVQRRAFITAGAAAKAAAAPVPVVRREADFDPAKHPREPAGGSGGGQFAAGGGAFTSSVTVRTVSSRAFAGESRQIQTTLTKQDVGRLGEQIVIDWLQQQGYADAAPLNVQRNNFPLDLVQDHEAIEVKTGLVSNGESAQHWRLTIGQPGKKETAWLARVTAAVKERWHTRKQKLIVERKQKALRDVSKAVGHSVKARTITVILDPDRKVADIYSFAGWHDRIGWNSDTARKGYVGSVAYRQR